MIWHSNSANDVLRELQVDPTVGLGAQEVAARLEEYGENRPQKSSQTNLFHAFIAYLRRPLTLLLLIVAAIVFVLDLYRQALLGEPTQWHWPLLVILATLVSTLLSALRQHNIDSLTHWMDGLSSPDACVRRDGREENVSSLTLVPGDIVLLSADDVVPADCRLIVAAGLRCDESNLTHATYPVEKDAEAVFDDITPLPQRTNMIYAGTTITAGSATAVVVATGSRSEWSRRLPPQENTATQKKVGRITVYWTVAAVTLAVIALIVGIARHDDLSSVWLTAAALAALTAPSSLSTLYSLLTAGSVQRLSRRHVRVMRPIAVDAMGRVTTIAIRQDLLHQSGEAALCRAFTGKQMVDLTESRPKAPGLLPLLRMAALNTSEHTPNSDAILSRLQGLSIDRKELLVDMPCVAALSPANGRNTTIHLADEQTLILSSGEWQSLLPLCSENTEKWANAATKMETEGLQVVAVAYRLSDSAPAVYTADEIERDLTCVGLLGLDIPLCDDDFSVPNARILLFSDQNTTAAIAEARSAGLADTSDVLTAEDERTMDDDALAEAVRHCNVYCGLDSAEQSRVIAALQAQGHIVAATAYQSKDAAILTTADVGMACGTNAANNVKTAADMILYDGNFAAIRAAITEGRFLRWKKIALFIYVLLCSVAMVLVGFGGLFDAFPLPNCALVITCVNLLCLAAPMPLWIASAAAALAQKFHK